MKEQTQKLAYVSTNKNTKKLIICWCVVIASQNYKIGRNFEYRVQRFFRKYGFYVNRSYASKGLFDLIAIPPTNKKDALWFNFPFGIQCKKDKRGTGYVAKEELQTLKDNDGKWQMIAVIIWSDKKGKLRMRKPDGTELSLEAVKMMKND